MNNFYKKITKFFQDNIFLYQELYLLEKDLLKLEKIEDNSLESIIVYSKKDLTDLIENGYDLGEFFRLLDLSEKFFRSQLLFGIFLNKILINISWLIIENKIEFHPPMKINFDCDAYIHYSISDPEYRGKGFYTYNLQKMSEYSTDLGKKKVIMAILKKNLSSLRAAEKAGFVIVGEGKFLKFLKFTYWKERY